MLQYYLLVCTIISLPRHNRRHSSIERGRRSDLERTSCTDGGSIIGRTMTNNNGKSQPSFRLPKLSNRRTDSQTSLCGTTDGPSKLRAFAATSWRKQQHIQVANLATPAGQGIKTKLDSRENQLPNAATAVIKKKTRLRKQDVTIPRSARDEEPTWERRAKKRSKRAAVRTVETNSAASSLGEAMNTRLWLAQTWGEGIELELELVQAHDLRL